MSHNTELTIAESDAIFERLRDMKSRLRRGCNKNDRCIALITVCIGEGFDKRRRIVGALTHLGFDRAHVILMLKEGQGPSPIQHRWMLGDDGRYVLHDEADVTS